MELEYAESFEMNTKPLLSRKDIADMLGDVTTEQVRKNERRWGLHVARRDLNCRCVRYRTIIVIRIFKEKGFLE